MQIYNDKIKIAGNWLYDYHYYRPVPYDFEAQNNPKRSGGIDDSDRASRRAKKEVRDLIYCNAMGVSENSDKFMTLTQAENIDDFDISVNEYSLFIKRLRFSKYYNGNYVRYLTVPEQQSRGSWHFHTVLFDAPIIPKSDLESIWGNGYAKINKIKNDEHLSNYLVKYITKDFKKGLYNRKSYFPSRKLLRPQEIIIANQVNDIRSKVAGIIPNWVSSKKTQLDGYRPCDIKIYNLSNYPDLIKV